MIFLLLASCQQQKSHRPSVIFARDTDTADVVELEGIQQSGTVIAGTLNGPEYYYEWHGHGMGEKGCVVAVGMIGCKHTKIGFLRGYTSMLERIEPSAIICFGEPFAEMQGNIIAVNYLDSRKVVR